MQQQRERIVFASHRDVVIKLFDAVQGNLRLVDLHQLRFVLVVVDEVHDLLWHGGGEQYRLMLLGNLIEDGFDVLTKAHAEHLVGLIENDHL